MKYNASLDLMAHAIECFNAGDIKGSTEAFARAAKHPSVKAALAAIEATNVKARASEVKASMSPRLQRLKASGDLDAKNVGQELREEVKDNKKMREVQEGAALDDFEEEDEVESSVTATFRRQLNNLHSAAS